MMGARVLSDAAKVQRNQTGVGAKSIFELAVTDLRIG
jgi:hypothetical protein